MTRSTRTVSSTWHGDLRCRVQAGGFSIDVDEPTSVGGSGAGPQPTDVFLASVASCFTIAVSWSALKRSIVLEHLEVEVTGVYDGPRFSEIEIVVDVGCPDEERDRLIEAAQRVCYVTNTLRQAPAMTVRTPGSGGDSGRG